MAYLMRLHGCPAARFLFAANAYARLLGCQEIQLIDPMSQDVVLYYARFGFVAERNRFGQAKYVSMEMGYAR
jgi:hypothetical protein